MHHSTFVRSEDLRRRFKQDVRAHQSKELDRFFGAAPAGAPTRKIVSRRKGRLPALAGYAKKPRELRVRYKGRIFKASVRQDGRIRFAGKLFSSPSRAGSAVCKHACDGWKFWTYERSPGDWVLLDELRK